MRFTTMTPMMRRSLACYALAAFIVWTALASWSLVCLYYLRWEGSLIPVGLNDTALHPVIDIPATLSWTTGSVAWWLQAFAHNDRHLRWLLLISATLPFLLIGLGGFAYWRKLRRRNRRPLWGRTAKIVDYTR